MHLKCVINANTTWTNFRCQVHIITSVIPESQNILNVSESCSFSFLFIILRQFSCFLFLFKELQSKVNEIDVLEQQISEIQINVEPPSTKKTKKKVKTNGKKKSNSPAPQQLEDRKLVAQENTKSSKVTDPTTLVDSFFMNNDSNQVKQELEFKDKVKTTTELTPPHASTLDQAKDLPTLHNYQPFQPFQPGHVIQNVQHVQPGPVQYLDQFQPGGPQPGGPQLQHGYNLEQYQPENIIYIDQFQSGTPPYNMEQHYPGPVQYQEQYQIGTSLQFQSGHAPNIQQPEQLGQFQPFLHMDPPGTNLPMPIESQQQQGQLNPTGTMIGVDGLLLGYQPHNNTVGYQQQQQQQQHGGKNHHLQYQGTVAKFIRDRREEDKAYGFIDAQSITEKGMPRSKNSTAPTSTTEVAGDVGGREQKPNDMFFSAHSVQSNLLDLQRGDEVEFRKFVSNKALARNNNKAKAANVTVVKLSRRDHDTLSDYLDKVKGILEPYSTNSRQRQRALYNRRIGLSRRGGFGGRLDSGDGEEREEKVEYDPQQMLKLISSPIVWQCVAEQISTSETSNSNSAEDGGDALLEKFLSTIMLLHDKIRTLDERFRQVLLHITSEHKFFNPVRGRFRGYVDKLANGWKSIGDTSTNNDDFQFFDSESSDDSIGSPHYMRRHRARNLSKTQRRKAELDSKKKTRVLAQKFLNLVAKVIKHKRVFFFFVSMSYILFCLLLYSYQFVINFIFL